MHPSKVTAPAVLPDEAHALLPLRLWCTSLHRRPQCESELLLCLFEVAGLTLLPFWQLAEVK